MTTVNHKRTYPTHDGHDMVEINRDEYQRLLKENKALKQENENLKKRQQWHRMDKDPAPVDEYVICYGGDDWNGKGYSMLKIQDKKDQFGNPIWTDGSRVPICIDEITHWMYMPQAPEDGK